MKAICPDGRDDVADSIGIKGLDEVVLVGVATLANAVFHTTGRRVRDLSITAESLF